MIHFSWEINLGNLLTGVPVLVIVIKMYGDWRLIKYRIGLMWAEYSKEHHIFNGSENNKDW